MAGETLLTLAEVLASLADNNSNLILPLDHRNQTVALAIDVGFLEEEATFTIPIINGTFVLVTQVLPSPSFLGVNWGTDGNNALIPDFTGIIINPGHTRLLSIHASLATDKVGGGTDNYTFQVHQAGAPVGREVSVELSGDSEPVVVETSLVYDYSVGGAINLGVRGDGTGDDISVEDFALHVEGVLT